MLTSSAITRSSCDTGWVDARAEDLGCLYFSHFRTQVKNAKTECRAQGAHLVNITGDPAGKKNNVAREAMDFPTLRKMQKFNAKSKFAPIFD